MPTPEVKRIKFIPQQEKRTFEQVNVNGVTHWLDRKLFTSDLIREPKPLTKELPKDAVSPIAERPQGMVESFKNSRMGKSLRISKLKEIK